MDNNSLTHHGIKGMRWGIRRFQNKDGTRTSLGKRRARSEDATDARNLRKKKVSEMSNAELKRLNERQRLEQEHARLNPGAWKKGLLVVGATAATLGTVGTLYSNGKNVIGIGKKTFDGIVDVVGDRLMKELAVGLAKPLH